ncbi:MAG: helix-turn-helix transcriptional regulator [Eubacteriales bacterium]|nr:helix-turn-helix transcriptional regulator [Eubacteriales bacterium]
MELDERLLALRKSNHFSQEEIAERLGVSRQAVSKWESGQGKPEIGNVIKLAEIYGVTTDYLLLGKGFAENIPQKQLSRTFRRMIAVIAIIGATAGITVLFIAALGLLSRVL